MQIADRISRLDENSRIVLRNVWQAFIVRGCYIVVSVVTVPLYIQYFNNNKVLGVWYTLLSVLIWFLNFDLGLGNGIRNKLVKDIAAKDYESARKTISSGVFSVGIVTMILVILGYFFIFYLDLPKLFNIGSDIVSLHTLRLSTIFVFFAIMLRFFLTIVSSIFYALQKSAINNILALCISILQLGYICIFKFDDANEALVNVSFAYIFLSNTPVLIAGIIVFHRELRMCVPSIRYIDKTYIKSILNIAILFFLCQILYMVIANTNEFFVTRYYGSEYTAEYTFYNKLTTIGTMAVSLALTPIWSTVTKAQAERNYPWLTKIYGNMKYAGLGVLVLQMIIVPAIPWIMDIWLGKGTVSVRYETAIAFALFSSVFLYSSMLTTIANGLAMLKVQIITFLVGVILKISLIITLYEFTSWTLVVWVNALILLPYIISQQVVFNRFFKRVCTQENENG